ncbi:MAG: hypothetical protein ACRERU_10610 [Methylococcales bacterium]
MNTFVKEARKTRLQRDRLASSAWSLRLMAPVDPDGIQGLMVLLA